MIIEFILLYDESIKISLEIILYVLLFCEFFGFIDPLGYDVGYLCIEIFLVLEFYVF